MDTSKKTIFTAIVLSIIGAVLGFVRELDLLSTLTPVALVIAFAVAMLMSNEGVNAKSSNINSQQASRSLSEEQATLYIGNIPYRANEETIKEYFENVCNVYSIRLMKDKRTGKKKGFGFIEVPPDAAEKVINKLNESLFMERNIIVRHAKEKVA